jgi:tRNA A37 threonylcarbamoyladenosine dehydratase
MYRKELTIQEVTKFDGNETECVQRYVGVSNDSAYLERTDRNKGWISSAEQEVLKNATVAIAGCGGMGGMVAAILARMGIGKIIIADPEVFDTSNLNRQFAAKQKTLGKNKALATAIEIQDITPDVSLDVYPQGITEETVAHILEGADVVCDLVEFWAVAPRLLIHEHAAAPIFVCDTVGHRTNLFYYGDNTMKIGEVLGMNYNQAKLFQEKMLKRELSEEEFNITMQKLITVFAPDVPEYSGDTEKHSIRQAVLDRLRHEQRASIIGTNPPAAASFLATHVVFKILEMNGFDIRNGRIQKPIPMPGYLSIDLALCETRVHQGVWWQQDE